MVNIDKNSTCSFSGHRAIPDGMAEHLLQRIKDGVNYLYSRGVKTYLTGGAIGFDTLAAKAVIECRSVHEDIRLIFEFPAGIRRGAGNRRI